MAFELDLPIVPGGFGVHTTAGAIFGTLSGRLGRWSVAVATSGFPDVVEAYVRDLRDTSTITLTPVAKLDKILQQWDRIRAKLAPQTDLEQFRQDSRDAIKTFYILQDGAEHSLAAMSKAGTINLAWEILNQKHTLKGVNCLRVIVETLCREQGRDPDQFIQSIPDENRFLSEDPSPIATCLDDRKLSEFITKLATAFKSLAPSVTQELRLSSGSLTTSLFGNNNLTLPATGDVLITGSFVFGTLQLIGDMVKLEKDKPTVPPWVKYHPFDTGISEEKPAAKAVGADKVISTLVITDERVQAIREAKLAEKLKQQEAEAEAARLAEQAAIKKAKIAQRHEENRSEGARKRAEQQQRAAQANQTTDVTKEVKGNGPSNGNSHKKPDGSKREKRKEAEQARLTGSIPQTIDGLELDIFRVADKDADLRTLALKFVKENGDLHSISREADAIIVAADALRIHRTENELLTAIGSRLQEISSDFGPDQIWALNIDPYTIPDLLEANNLGKMERDTLFAALTPEQIQQNGHFLGNHYPILLGLSRALIAQRNADEANKLSKVEPAARLIHQLFNPK